MAKNIFENAKMGDRFICRNGNKAVFLSRRKYNSYEAYEVAYEYELTYENGEKETLVTVCEHYDSEGKYNTFSDEEDPVDIVAKGDWQ